jgi:regulation of enolase protein 1 (concanavalin A-like superfamily)
MFSTLAKPAKAAESFSDEFESSTLDQRWSWIDPNDDCNYSLTENPGFLRISVPVGGNDLYHYTNRDAPRVLQSIDENFVVETKLICDPQSDAQGAGILVWQDTDNYLRLDRIKHMITRQVVDVSGEKEDTWYYFAESPYSSTTTYLRLERFGSIFTSEYSSDGSTWEFLTNVTFAFSKPISIGLFIINQYQDYPIYADFDYFRINASAKDVTVKDVAKAKTVICQGYSGNVSVTVENKGDYEETFNTTLYANLTSSTINNTGLVGYWKFDEGIGATAYDSSGNGNDGTINGASWVEGRLGGALEFDGVDDYVEVPDSASLNPTSAITVCAWFKEYNPQTTEFPPIVKKTGDPSGYTLELHYWKFGGGVCIDGIWRGGPPPVSPLPVPFEWCHLAITYDGSNIIRYANGAEISRETVTGTITPTSNALYIGRCLSMSRFFNGTIDEAKIYNRALSANEIWTEYALAPITIQTQSATIANHSFTILTFVWNTQGFAKGNYTLWAYAWPIAGETNTTNNLFIDKWIIVSMVGDIIGPYGYPDGKCDMMDIAPCARRFGVYYVFPPPPLWDPNYDITNDGQIDIRDISIVARHFGEIDP